MMRSYIGLKTNKDVLVVSKSDGLYELNENKKLRQVDLTFYNLENKTAIECYDYLKKHNMDYIIDSMSDHHIVIRNIGLKQRKVANYKRNANRSYRFHSVGGFAMLEFENHITRIYGYSIFSWETFFKILLSIPPENLIQQKDLYGLKRKRYKGDGQKIKYTSLEKMLAIQALRGSMRFCNLMHQNDRDAWNEMDQNYMTVNYHQAKKIVDMAKQSRYKTMQLLLQNSVGKTKFADVINGFEGSF